MPKASKLPRKSGPMISVNPPPSAIKAFAEQAEQILRRADKLVTDANALRNDETARKTAKRSR